VYYCVQSVLSNEYCICYVLDLSGHESHRITLPEPRTQSVSALGSYRLTGDLLVMTRACLRKQACTGWCRSPFSVWICASSSSCSQIPIWSVLHGHYTRATPARLPAVDLAFKLVLVQIWIGRLGGSFSEH
jgi:hypothetical protein